MVTPCGSNPWFQGNDNFPSELHDSLLHSLIFIFMIGIYFEGYSLNDIGNSMDLISGRREDG